MTGIRSSPFAALAVSAAVGWVGLATLRGRFWSTDVRLPEELPESTATPPEWPAVCAVVPARDEAAMLPATLPALLGQDYPGRFVVVVVDDDSRDGTGAVAAELARECGAQERLRLVSAGARPDAWAGKVWAMRQGIEAVLSPPPDHAPCAHAPFTYVLFTDADIEHPPSSVRRLVQYARETDRDLVSLMALLRCETWQERLVVPAFVYFFGQLYPFRWVAEPCRRTAAAAGGCMLVRRDALTAIDRLDPMRGALIDDIALARLVKRRTRAGRGRIWLGHSVDVRSRRPYPKLADLWEMVARSAFTQLRHSTVLLGCTVAGLLFGYALPPAALVVGTARCARRRDDAVTLLVAGAAGCVTMWSTYLPAVRLYGLGRRWALSLPVAAVVYLGMTVDSAVRHWSGRGGAWKGRAYA